MEVGVLGAGQLARMLALAGWPLGLRFRFLDPAEDACAFGLGQRLCGAWDDPDLLRRLADGVDVVTYEFEKISAEGVARLAEHAPVLPGPRALELTQDRLTEKECFRALGIDVPDFVAVSTEEELRAAVDQLGLPCVVKTRREGYDGKGQCVLRQEAELPAAWQRLGGKALIAEAFVPFDREVSAIAVRGRDGATRHYPLSENVHVDGILRTTHSRPGDPLTAAAQRAVGRLLDHLDYVGVLALELFDVGGRLMANEFAPRVHNSGHWTIEGAATSQFENHLRAVCGLPLGSTEARGLAAMVNLIGAMPDEPAALLAIEGAHLHDYAKAPRPGRKLGHVTVVADDPAELTARIEPLAGRADARRG